jgi:hypothetical protein
MKEVYAEILKTKSLTVIGYKAEAALEIVDNPIDKQALLKIMETNNLDLAWAIAHEQLGQMEQATVLRQWVASKAKRQQWVASKAKRQPSFD